MLRSTWDYSARLANFSNWLDRAALATRVVNPPEVIRWNLDKHYLAELQRADVPTVPTLYAEPGDEAGNVLDRFLHEHAAAELIIKPAVGSGARDAQRLPARCRRDASARISHACSGRASQRAVAALSCSVSMSKARPRSSISGGAFSHAIGKAAVLQSRACPDPGAVRARADRAHAPPNAEQLELGARVLAALPVR